MWFKLSENLLSELGYTWTAPSAELFCHIFLILSLVRKSCEVAEMQSLRRSQSLWNCRVLTWKWWLWSTTRWPPWWAVVLMTSDVKSDLSLVRTPQCRFVQMDQSKILYVLIKLSGQHSSSLVFTCQNTNSNTHILIYYSIKEFHEISLSPLGILVTNREHKGLIHPESPGK